MTHPDRAIAHSRAVEDAYKGVYNNREGSHRGKVAYDSKWSEVARKLEGLPGCKGTDEDVHKANRSNNQSV